jgi:hypothetical protein
MLVLGKCPYGIIITESYINTVLKRVIILLLQKGSLVWFGRVASNVPTKLRTVTTWDCVAEEISVCS